MGGWKGDDVDETRCVRHVVELVNGVNIVHCQDVITQIIKNKRKITRYNWGKTNNLPTF